MYQITDIMSVPFGPVTLTILALLAFPLGKAIYNLYFHPLARLPGPRTWAASRLPFVSSVLRGWIAQDFVRLHRQYGPIVRTAPDEVSFASPQAWTDILANRPGKSQFLKDPTWWQKIPGQPHENVVTAIDIAKHAQVRRLLAPAFSARALRGQEPVLQKYVRLLVERLQAKVLESGTETNIDITPWLNFTPFDIFGDLGLGESFDCLENSQYHPWIELIFGSVRFVACIAAARYFPLVEFLLLKCIPASLQKEAESHRQQITDKVDRRLSWEIQRPDIMSYLIDENGKAALPHGELIANFEILTTAGSETSATILTGIISHLVDQPESLAGVTEEIRNAFKENGEVTLDSVRDLKYLNAVINEGLRYCPAVPWMLPRIVPDGGETICGEYIPGGSSVTISVTSINRDPKSFYKAESFLPERWLPDALTNPKSPFFHDDRQAVQTFSVGPRACIGQHLAWAEMQLILANLFLNFDFKALKNKTLEWDSLRSFVVIEREPVEIQISLAACP